MMSWNQTMARVGRLAPSGITGPSNYPEGKRCATRQDQLLGTPDSKNRSGARVRDADNTIRWITSGLPTF